MSISQNLQKDFFKPGLDDVLQRIATLTKKQSQSIDVSRKERFSQYFTEGAVAKQMASMLSVGGGARIGDHGAGTGILGATVLAHAVDTMPLKGKPFTLKAYEIDELLHASFARCMEEVSDFAAGLCKPAPNISLKGDFTELANDLCFGRGHEQLDAVILNPPYKKLNQGTALAQLMRSNLVSTPNLYAAFIVLSVLMLRPGGQMVAIVPRSFTNGTYFRGFRTWLRQQGAIDWFVRYKRRSNVFRGDNVLQENVTFRFVRGVKQCDRVRVSLCDSPESPPVFESMVPTRDVFPEETDIIYVPANAAELNALHKMRQLPYSADELGLSISTGKLEDFRVREYLCHSIPDGKWAPVIYSQHWERGSTQMAWSSSTSNGKPACLKLNSDTIKKTIPRGNYVLVKRISANDDRTGRCNPCVLTEDMDLPGDVWSVDNHLQVISATKGKMSRSLAGELAAYLESQDVDHVLRLVSGTTQLNRADLMQLRFPESCYDC